MKNKVIVSTLRHSWILDLDGTIVKHNGYLVDGQDSLLDGAFEFINSIPSEDLIIIITARKEKYRQQTIDFLKKNNIRYDHIIFEAPYGERILVNDNKPSGLQMGLVVNKDRDASLDIDICIDEKI